MRNIDLTTILKEQFDLQQGIFKPLEYRMALILLNPSQDSLENFFQYLVQQSLAYTEGILSVTNAGALKQILGTEGSMVRLAINSAFRVQNNLPKNSSVVEESLLGTRDFLRNFIESEAIHTVSEISNLKDTNNRKLIGLPDRLAKHRSLAEDALVKSILDPVDRVDWLDDAINRLDEVLEQPIGAKDPYSWLLIAWAKQRKNDIGGGVHEALSQACLTASANQDELFSEAHRALAGFFAEKKRFDKAASTLMRVIGANDESESRMEYVIYSASAGIQKEALLQYKYLVTQKPFTAFLPISNSFMAQNGAAWINIVKEVASVISSSATENLAAWKTTLDEIKVISEDHPTIVDKLSALEDSFIFLEDRLRGSHIFESAFLANEAQRMHDDLKKSVTNILDTERAKAQSNCQNLEAQKQHLRHTREESVAVLKGYRSIKENQDRYQLQLGNDDTTKLQNGCGTSLLSGLGGFGIYFFLVMIFSGFANSSGPGTKTGQIIMSALLIPPILGGLLTVMDALRKNAAHGELTRRGKMHDHELEQRITEIKAQFEASCVDLDVEAEKAQKELDKCKESSKKLSELQRQQKRAA